MTFDEIEEKLPWGLHDAGLERLEIDWIQGRVLMDVRVKMSERQDVERPGRVTVTGLVFCSVEAPEIDPPRGYDAIPAGGLSIDTGSGVGDEASGATLPRMPAGAFLQWFFVRQWNRFIHICGRTVEFSWTD